MKRAGSPVSVVREGKATAVVVLSAGAGEACRRAAKEIVRVVRKATGAVLPVVAAGREPAGAAAIVLCVGSLGRRPARALPPDDGFRLRCRDGRIEITAAREDALPFAVAGFLEEIAGARWFFPGPLGEDIPVTRNLSFPAGDTLVRPSFDWRSLAWRKGGAISDWEVRNGLPWLPISGGHAYTQVLPRPLFKKHPEFFSLICGERRVNPSQICMSAPGVIDRTMEYVDSVLAENPCLVAVSLCPADVDYFCECAACRRGENPTKYYDLYVNEPAYGYGGPGYAGHLSERVFRYTNTVADRVAEKHPGLKLIVYAYGAYRYPPEGMGIRDNVIVWLTTTCLGWADPERRRLEIERIAAWRKIARHVVIFEAFSNQAWPEIPRIAPREIADACKAYRRLGVQGFYSQMFGDFGTNLPNYWVAVRLLWDASRDPERELRELFCRCYGPAAGAMRDYWGVLEASWRRVIADGTLEGARSIICPHNEYLHIARLYPRRVLDEARAALAKAARAAGPGVYGRRVALAAKGFRYTELTVAAIRESLALEDMGFPPTYFAPWLNPDYDFSFFRIYVRGKDKRVAIHALERTIAAWDRREACARALAGTGVVSGTLLERNRRFDPRPVLKKMLAVTGEMNTRSVRAGRRSHA